MFRAVIYDLEPSEEMSPKFSTNCKHLFKIMMDKLSLTPNTLSPQFLLTWDN